MKLLPPFVISILLSVSVTAQTNVFLKAEVKASSGHPKYSPQNAVDGEISRRSTWMSERGSRPPHTLDVILSRYYDIDSVVIYTGIPDKEKNDNERIQSPGFWSVKNFILQYWDDANWTDISETLTTENRQERISFRFSTPITSFRFRLRSTDGEAIRIVELEGYGRINRSLPAPTKTQQECTSSAFDHRPSNIMVRIGKETTGRTMKYVGYNQGYFVPGSNVAAWLEYSGVNAVRLWADLRTYVHPEWVDNKSIVKDPDEFDRLKRIFRDNPLNGNLVRWDSIDATASRLIPSTNTMVLKYALQELNKQEIDIVLQSGYRVKAADWSEKWLQWQRYYALAFYLAREGNVHMFAMQNEPNHRHAGPVPLDVWIDMMRIASDAIRCAIADVNRIYEKHLTPRFVGPVTAGTNTNWWAKIAASERIDYRGNKCDYDLIDIFSTHSYNLPAAGYEGKVQSIDKILRDNHPLHDTKPIVFTEIGRWMNAYLIDKEETMDSPSLFTEWAGIYTRNMQGGGYGMWAFKFANTASSTYPRGIKSGHHYIWKGKRFAEDSYENLALGKPARASGTDTGYSTTRLTDGSKADDSAWASSSEEEKWVEIDLGRLTPLGGIAIYTGSAGGVFTAPDRIRSLKIQISDRNGWKDIPGTEETACRYAQLYYTFPEGTAGSRIRIIIRDKGKSVIREIKLFPPHTLSDAPESYDISGVQRTAQVVRLFAKGFKNQRPLLHCDISVQDPDLDICSSADSLSGNIYIWLVQRNPVNYNLVLNLKDLGIGAGTPVVYEQVSADRYGEAEILKTTEGGLLTLTLPAQSVGLLTLPMKATSPTTLFADKCISVRGGKLATIPQRSDLLGISLDSRSEENSRVTYLNFPCTEKLKTANRIVLGLHGYCPKGTKPFRFHIYCMQDGQWEEKSLSWANAPGLDPHQARATEVGSKLFVAGEMTMTSYPSYHYLDVTDVIKKHADKGATFMLIREVREPGDDYDKGRIATISPRDTDTPPLLELW